MNGAFLNLIHIFIRKMVLSELFLFILGFVVFPSYVHLHLGENIVVIISLNESIPLFIVLLVESNRLLK
jgi:hypothetical protein